jgi:hypothetical protein
MISLDCTRVKTSEAFREVPRAEDKVRHAEDKVRPVNSMSFIWNDNMREKREANANAT